AVVLSDVPAHTTVAGVPARVVSRLRADEEPALSMDQSFGFGDGI
ncbi:serine O-acetyltransferase, partial [Methylobacterium hispanicum]